jgi:hypothetical protein
MIYLSLPSKHSKVSAYRSARTLHLLSKRAAVTCESGRMCTSEDGGLLHIILTFPIAPDR